MDSVEPNTKSSKCLNCKKELADPVIPNEEELITTLTYTLISTDHSDTATFSFSDLDGPGGDAPIITADPLQSNLMYDGTITLLNEQENPPENITEAEARATIMGGEVTFQK